MKYFIEIYYSSFTRNTIYSRIPKDVCFLKAALKETDKCFYLKTKAVVIFDFKNGANKTYRNFQRLDFIEDRDKIDELIGRENTIQTSLKLIPATI